MCVVIYDKVGCPEVVCPLVLAKPSTTGRAYASQQVQIIGMTYCSGQHYLNQYKLSLWQSSYYQYFSVVHGTGESVEYPRNDAEINHVGNQRRHVNMALRDCEGLCGVFTWGIAEHEALKLPALRAAK